MWEPDGLEPDARDLAQALRKLRKAAGLSGERLALRCAMSQSKISRIECGRTLPTVTDVESILRALDVPPGASNELVKLARTANVQHVSWRTVAESGFWRKQVELKSLAEASNVVRQFLPAIPSGLIQTEAYARQALTSVIPGAPARNVEKALRARLDSRRVLLDEGREFMFVLTEQAVRWRRVADTAVLAEQCLHMAEVARRPNIELAVVPESATVLAAPLHVYTVYDDRLVTVELSSGEIAIREPTDIAYYTHHFQYFLGCALRGADAIELLRSVHREFMRDVD